MCDDTDLEKFAAKGLTRRDFTATGALAGLAACTSMESGKPALTEATVRVPTPDGTMDALFVHPAKPAPAVILWPDIAGIRPAKQTMARRLAGAGYAVLVPNPYYRDLPAPQFSDFADFVAQKGFEKVGPWRSKLSVDSLTRDQRAAAEWLAGQPAVDAQRGMGTQGYCMTGSAGLVGPAASPAIKAGASFHGGGLATDKPNSPHTMLRRGAGYLIAISQDDDAKQPEAKTILRQAADKTGANAEIEVYPADHGWCVPDSPAYDQPQAERAWERLLALYAKL